MAVALPQTRALDVRNSRAFQHGHVDHAGPKAGDGPKRRELHAIEQLATTIDDIINRLPLHHRRGANPEIAVGAGVQRGAFERRHIVGKIAERRSRDDCRQTC